VIFDPTGGFLKTPFIRDKCTSTVAGPHGILLVSTDPEDYASLTRILEGGHWTVSIASSCTEACSTVRENNTAVVVCQSNLPDGTWRDMLCQCLNFEVPPRVIVLSRLVDHSFWAEVLNLGGYDLLAKPLDAKEVLRVVSMASRYRRHTPSVLQLAAC
jgi:DNA-binding response OmpR family regulator